MEQYCYFPNWYCWSLFSVLEHDRADVMVCHIVLLRPPVTHGGRVIQHQGVVFSGKINVYVSATIQVSVNVRGKHQVINTWHGHWWFSANWHTTSNSPPIWNPSKRMAWSRSSAEGYHVGGRGRLPVSTPL